MSTIEIPGLVQMESEEAEARIARINSAVDGVWDDLIALYIGRAWIALGYTSWDGLCDARFRFRPKLPSTDRQGVVLDMTEAGMSTRAIAAALGVSHPTVINDQKTAGGQDLPPAPVTGLDGKTYTRAPVPHVAHNSGQNEWYTPSPYLEAARHVLDGFDLDPASSDTAQRLVQADRYYTAATDGIASDWGDAQRVWMNPPYAQPLIGQFIAKFTAHCTHPGRTGIALVNNATDTAWGAELLSAADAVCFPTGRIKFLDMDGNPGGAPLQGQMIALVAGIFLPSELETYLGPFTAAFGGYGPVMVRG